MHLKIYPFGKYILLFLTCIFLFQIAFTQNRYKDSIISYQQNYVNTHEVVSKDDRKYMHFFNVDKSYRVKAFFKKINDIKGFYMSTASGKKQQYFHYGLLTFRLRDSVFHLFIYQSASLMHQEKYEDYLFVPFTDGTSGFESYGGGRYLDFIIPDIHNNHLVIDFNKAYNPYCAYTSGYDCPIPPKENLLNIAINAGEKNYGKPLH